MTQHTPRQAHRMDTQATPTPNLHAALLAATTMQAPAAAAALAWSLEPALSPLASLGRIAARARKAYDLWKLERRVRATLGRPVPVGGELLEQMMLEVDRHQWLEAERAGRNIWAERDPRNPRAAAMRDWFVKHFGAWYYHQAPKVSSCSEG